MADATERQRQALEAERDAARASEAEARKKVAAGAKLVHEAQEEVIEADRKARLAWAPVRRIRTMLGRRGRLARWIADVPPEDRKADHAHAPEFGTGKACLGPMGWG